MRAHRLVKFAAAMAVYSHKVRNGTAGSKKCIATRENQFCARFIMMIKYTMKFHEKEMKKRVKNRLAYIANKAMKAMKANKVAVVKKTKHKNKA